MMNPQHRTAHQSMLNQKMKNFRLETQKLPDNSYECKVFGQDIKAKGPSESDAIRNCKNEVERLFNANELKLDRTMM